MFSITKAVPGDILLYKSGEVDLIGAGIVFFSNLGRLFRQGGKYVHAGIYLGSGRIIHSHLNVDKRLWISGATETGVHIARIPDTDYHKIDIYRVASGLRGQEVIRLVRWCRNHLGASYDLGAFPSSFFRSVIARIFGWENFSKQRPILNDPDRWFCSEFVSSAFFEALDLDIVPGIHQMSQTPSDLGSAKSSLSRVF